jgi:hypothetical protein
MEHNLSNTIALLTRTPATLDTLLRDLPDAWTHSNDLGGQLKADNFWTGKTDNFRRPRLVSSTSMCPPFASPYGLSSASFWVRT